MSNPLPRTNAGVAPGFARTLPSPNAPARSTWTRVQSTPVHVRTAGASHERTLVLLPGTSFDASTWERLGTLEHFALAGFRTVAVDPPGHGLSPRAPVDVERWLAQLYESLGIERAALVAPSISGRFALPFVTGHPDRTTHFIAVATTSLERYRERLSSITASVLAVWDDTDKTVPVSRADLLIRRAGAKRALMTGSGHAPHVKDPDRFHDEALQFLLRSAPLSARVRPNVFRRTDTLVATRSLLLPNGSRRH